MKLRVLIADPNREFQQMITALLSQERDMEAADVSSDGLEALTKIKTPRPDVVLLDLVQPRLDGLGVLRRLAAQENAPPVLVLTGFVNSHVIAECSELGAAYLRRIEHGTANPTINELSHIAEALGAEFRNPIYVPEPADTTKQSGVPDTP